MVVHGAWGLVSERVELPWVRVCVGRVVDDSQGGVVEAWCFSYCCFICCLECSFLSGGVGDGLSFGEACDAGADDGGYLVGIWWCCFG